MERKIKGLAREVLSKLLVLCEGEARAEVSDGMPERTDGHAVRRGYIFFNKKKQKKGYIERICIHIIHV